MKKPYEKPVIRELTEQEAIEKFGKEGYEQIRAFQREMSSGKAADRNVTEAMEI